MLETIENNVAEAGETLDANNEVVVGWVVPKAAREA